MSIVATGTEIVECLRIVKLINQHGESFLRRIYTNLEIDYCSARAEATQHYAACWAGKRSVLKALGVSYGDGMNWKDIEILAEGSGRFRVRLGGMPRRQSVARSVGRIHVSVSACRIMAVGFAVLEEGTRSA